MNPSKLLLVVAVMVGFAALAYAGFDQAIEAYHRGNYAKAYTEMRALAEQGNADAQFYLGVMYSNGQGIPQDYAEAMRWLRKSAEQGNTRAQSRIGFAYEHGEGVPQDYAEAVNWYGKAADQGDGNAQVLLGNMYANGYHVVQDYAEAVKWCRKAAEQGDTRAQTTLGWAYADGNGVPQDYVQAHMWFNLAAAQGGSGAQVARDSIAKLMTPAQIAEAERLAIDWKPKSSALAADTETKRGKQASAKEVYELSEKCAKFAAEWIKRGDFAQRKYKDWIRTGAGYYTNHYNRKLNKCFIAVDSVIKLTGRTHKTLWDINENKRYGWFTSSLVDPDKAADCTMLGNPCKSESEWDALVKPYMEE